MLGVLTLLRGVLHRAGTSTVIFVVALCAAAAATVGPTYYVAARDSILQDTVTGTSVTGRGLTVTQSGETGDTTLDSLRTRVRGELVDGLGSDAAVDRLFQPPIQSLETTVFFTHEVENVPLVWRTDVCQHLHFKAGRCMRGRGETIASSSLMLANFWHLGQIVHPANHYPLKIVGVYDPPDPKPDYWFARGSVYFPNEQPTLSVAPFDTLFVTRSTINDLPGHPQGNNVVSQVLAAPRLLPADVDSVSDTATALTITPGLLRTGATIITGVPVTMAQVHASWSALQIPVVVVTAELLVLTWLLLFLVVTDAVDARGTEIALAKLRGFGGGRSLVVGVGEPVALLALSFPIGCLLGWALTGALAGVLLRHDTAVPLPAIGWGAAAIAALGGIAAVVVAARRTLVRPVVEQWRRATRRANDRGWVFDAVVLTAAVAGLVQLAVTGRFSSTQHSALALLVPGLLGLAIAVVASRALPVICRALFSRTRRGGGLGPFLAVRHIARRPGGTRTTMILATAVALATFSIASWNVGSANRQRIAQVTVGAPTVLTVIPPVEANLADVVDHVDPSGRSATAVLGFSNGSVQLLAVQPDRFARIAHWSAGSVDDPQRLLSSLHPASPAPVVVDGTDVRVRVERARIGPGVTAATLDVFATGAASPTPVDLGVLHRGRATQTLTGSLSGCPCVVRDVQLSPFGGQPAEIRGRVTIAGIEVRNGGVWRPVAGFAGRGHWSDPADQQVQIDATEQQVSWSFFAPAGTPPTLHVVDRPDPLPAVVTHGVVHGNAAIDASGVDAATLAVAPVAAVPGIPGAGTTGVVVDLDYALRVTGGNSAPSTAQVWVRGDPAPIRAGLAQAHIPVLSTTRSADVAAALGRQGPGLASVLFLADAVAAALLAALAAIVSLAAAARRRRYEYAALAATGASQRTLYAALAIEQIVVIGFGTLVGIASGLLASALAGRSVPEFIVEPSATLLHYSPSWPVMLVAVGGALVLLLGVAAVAASALLRSVTPDQLREAQT